VQLFADFAQDVVVIDPPWGGPQYSSAVLPDLFMGETSLTELALQLRHHCDLVCVRLPLNYNADELVDRLLSAGLAFSTVASPPAPDAVSPSLGGSANMHEDWVRLAPSRRPGPADSDSDSNRPFIYRVDFDVSRLLIVCYPARARSRVRFSLGNLDAVIAAANAWNVSHGKQHHPAFFDWDKRRWVPLSRWHGTAPAPRPAAAVAATAAPAAAAAAVPAAAAAAEGSAGRVGVSASGVSGGVPAEGVSA
jgi:hypothetical protein